MSLFTNNVSFFNNNGFNNLSATNSIYKNSMFSGNSTNSSNSIFDVISLSYGVNNKKSSFVTSNAVQDYGNSLSAVLTGLNAKGNRSLFNQIGASSSTSTVASAAVDNSKFNEAKNAPVNLNVAQTAKAQINSGDALRSSGRNVNSGNYGFAIDINGQEQRFSIKVDMSDDNESIQKKMAAAINDRDIGVTAAVTTDSVTNTTKLSLTADETGNENEDDSPVFEVRDTRGNLAEEMGITQISQNAQNAVYSVDGEARTSTSNNVDVGNGVTATLKSAGQTSFTFQRDGSGSIDEVKELVSTLNSILMEAANTEGRGSDKLGEAVSSMNKAYKDTLNKVGINVSAGGMLSVDDDKLKAAAEDGSLERLFQSNGNYGFAYRAERLGSNMSDTNMFANEVSAADSSYNYNTNGMNYYNYASTGSLLDSLF